MIVYAVPLLLAAAFFIPALSFKSKKFAELLSIVSLGIAFLLVVGTSFSVLKGNILTHYMMSWIPPIGIVIVVDGLSIIMALLITLLGLLTAVFSLRFIRYRQVEYYTLLTLLFAGMLGFCITGDLFNMYVFLEIMSVSSYALTSWLRTKESVEGAVKFLLVGSLATGFILIGTALFYGLTGSLTLADMGRKIIPGVTFYTALSFILGGFAVKSALVPFHFWKPDAIQGSVEPVAGIFSALSTSLGIYGILRILFIFDMLGFSWILIGTGFITMIVGALMALVQKSLKRLLAYSSISQMGYVMASLGTGGFGMISGLLHLFNNAVLKVLLFLCVGVIVYHMRSDEMDKLGGLGNRLYMTSFCFFIGILGVVGIPGTNGFVSKFMIYLAFWKVNPLLTFIAVIVSAVTLAYYLKAFTSVFLGPERKKYSKTEKTPKIMLIPLIILTTICIVLGCFPELGIKLISPAAHSLTDLKGYVQSVMGR